MVRTPASIRGWAASSTDEGSSDESDSSGSLRRKLLLGVGLAGVAYVVARRLRSDRDSTDDSGDWYQLSIDESVEEASDEAAAGDDDGATAPDAEGDATDEDLPGEERTDEEIAQRGEEDIQAEPAPPGEMNVDEEVVEEVVDDETEEE